MKNKKLSKEEFKKLVGILRATYREVCFSKIGHKKIGGESWKNFSEVWNWILISLRHYYLSRIANIFDKPSSKVNGEERLNLSIFRAIPKDKFSETNQKTIDNIKALRNKTGGHLDAEDIMKGKMSEVDYDLDFEKEKIEALISETFKHLNQISKDYDYAEELNQEQEKKYVEGRFNEWYKIFEEK